MTHEDPATEDGDRLPVPADADVPADPSDVPDAADGVYATPDRRRELLRFLPDVARLFLDVVRDPRVPLKAKITAGAVGAYLVSPVDVVPDFIPVAGQMDDLAIALWGLRQLLQAAGYDVLKDLWRGSHDGFAVVLMAAGVQR